MAGNYSELQSQFDRVRRAWKRAAAVKGLSIVIIELIGMLLLLSAIDFVYRFPQPIRILGLALVSSAVGLLIFRHVLRPLLRNIPDSQIALYIEERQQGSHGALLSAAVFGGGAHEATSEIQNHIIQSIVQTAVRDALQLQWNRVLDLSKLKKYVIATMFVLLFVGLSAVRYSALFNHHANRLLLPWHMSEEDRKSTGTLIESDSRPSFEITLDPPGERIAAGSALLIKARLSCMPASDVFLRYRLKNAGEFKKLKMSEIEEVNSFAARLPDINDNLEFYVQCGKFVSNSISVAVYDPLILKDYEITLTPPAYTRQQPSKESSTSADIAALEGTTVTFRPRANVPLLSGELHFQDGTSLPLNATSKSADGIVGEFVIRNDQSYTVSLVAADGQPWNSNTVYVIKSMKDQPPTVEISDPGQDMTVHPSAEVTFKAKVADDVGIAKLDLVYNSSQNSGKTERLEVKLGSVKPGEQEAEATLSLPDLKPPLKAGSTLFYHFETWDLKGQATYSDIFMVKVRPYEIAGSFPDNKQHHPHPPALDLMLFIAAAWNIESQRDRFERSEYDSRCESLAEKMLMPDGTLKKFKKPKGKGMTAEKIALIKQGEALVLKGAGILKAHDAGTAVATFRDAISVWDSIETSAEYQQMLQAERQGESPDNHSDPLAESLGFQRMDKPSYVNRAEWVEVTLPEYQRAIKSEDAKKLYKQAADLEKREQQLIAETKKLAESPEEVISTDETKPDSTENQQAAGASQPDDSEPEEDDSAPEPEKHKHKQMAANANKLNNDKKDKPGHGEGKGGKSAQKENSNITERKSSTQQGNQIADRNERKKELAGQQKDLAAEVQKLAQQISANASHASKETREIVQQLRDSSQAMETSATEIKNGNLQQAAAHGDDARRDLNMAAQKLMAAQFSDMDKAVEAADERCALIVANQKQIAVAAQQVLRDARKRAENEKAPDSQPRLNAQDAQKMQGLAKLQAANQQTAENLEAYVKELEKWAANVQRKETVERLRDAARIMANSRLSDVMTTAVVNLKQQETSEVDETLDKVSKTLNKLSTALQAASSSLAQTHEEKIKRALNGARDIASKVEILDKDGKTQSENSGKASNETAKAGSVRQANGDKKASPAENKTLSTDERRALQSEVYMETHRLSRWLKQDQLANEAVSKNLQGAAVSEEQFGEMFEHDSAKLEKYVGVLRNISSELEGKLDGILKSKRLSAAQREQTPLQYREMVKSYYEQLSKQ